MTLDVEALYREHGADIRAYLGRRLSDDRLAEDLAQDVWVRVVQHAGRYVDTGCPVSAWLRRIAHNLLMDHYRRRTVLAFVRLGALDPSYTVGQDDHVEQIETQEALDRAMGVLTQHQRDVIRARYLEGRSTRETSEATGHTEEGVKQLQKRGLVNLKRALGAA